MWLLFITRALAESAAAFPAGAASVYSGVGVYSFRKLRTGADPEETVTLYRDVTIRGDLHATLGATDALSLSLYAPLVHSRVLDEPGLGDCAQDAFPCAPIVTLGTLSLAARYQIAHVPLDVSPGVVLASSSWNAPTRGYYNTVGEATTDIGPSLHIGDRYEGEARSLSWVASCAYTWRNTFYDASGGAPHDDIRAAFEVSGQSGPLALTLGTSTYQRLGGIEVASLLGTEDRWALSDYDNASAHAKLSVALGGDMGLHVSASRVLWVRNGPPDAFDLALGVHRYFAPRATRDRAL